ncbi:MAG TPA: hypothetical protein H9881_16415 [Candidatus Stackebrandtia excrementipullorum]|nr:hypothetical protein [Candidatus Stackebrandtia excrementipullorum]
MSASNKAPPTVATTWHEYPVGFIGESARALLRTLIPFFAGVGATFVLLLVGSIVLDEGVVGYRLTEPLDTMFRTSMLVFLVVAYLSTFALAVAVGVRDTSTSRALDNAALSNAAVTEVPHPGQIEHVIEPPWWALLLFQFGHLLIGVCGLIAGFMAFGEEASSTQVVLGSLGLIALVTPIIFWTYLRAWPAHGQRRIRISQHWTTGREKAAWKTARGQSLSPVDGSEFTVSARRMKLGTTLATTAAVFGVVAVIVLVMHLFITHPDATGQWRYDQPDAGPRAELDATSESILAAALSVGAVLAVLAVVVFAIGVLVEGAAHTAEKAALRRALEHSAGGRPPADVLKRHSERRSPRTAEVLAAFSGVGMIVGPTGWLVGTFDTDMSHGFASTGIAIVGIAVAFLVGSLIANAVANVRGQAMRNELLHRWPSIPRVKRDEDGKVKRVRKGPALKPAKGEFAYEAYRRQVQ